ncbi:MAG: arabinofuranosyltransferase [Candidatus Zixiibacteriota bacterium]|nr:MAG: arabinofuranosyltransferase [candidate division Zixibacteria bacterium]
MNKSRFRWTASLKQKLQAQVTVLPLILAIGYLYFALYLFRYSHVPKVFHEDVLIRDLILLDAWGLSFFLIVITLWVARVSWRLKSFLLAIAFSLYGFITVSLMFDGTPFGLNGYSGDQGFRMTMILKFATFKHLGDFYYRDLPAFYPPVVYYLLSLYSRLFSVENYKMVKIASMGIYLIGPFLLYYMWRRLVTPFQAIMVTFATYLFCSLPAIFPFKAPHAFLANTLFVPWWLYYIERVRRPRSNWKYYLAGGLIGGCLFMTYFYPFFIGAFLLLIRTTILRGWTFLKDNHPFRFVNALGVLAVSALVSAIYWFPVLRSIIENGIDRSRGGWHHLGSPGLDFPFVEFTLPGILFLAALIFSLRRSRRSLHKGLLLLIGSVVVYFLAGSLLGYIDRPINLVKSREFVAMAGGPFIGLAAAALVRSNIWRNRRNNVMVVLAAVLLLVFIHNFHAHTTDKDIQVARKTTLPPVPLEDELSADITGRVALSGYDWIFSFHPVYTFIARNEHYGHPACEYLERHNLLYLLHDLSDPCLFNIGLRHNVFDTVDYYLPRKQGRNLEVYANLSNYPNRFTTRIFRIDQAVVSDTRLFQNVGVPCRYKVVDIPDVQGIEWTSPRFTSQRDSLAFLVRAAHLQTFLDPDGQTLVSEYLGTGMKDWRRITDRAIDFGDSISMPAGFVVNDNDSTYFLFCFQPRYDLDDTLKISLQVRGETGKELSFDFYPDPPSYKWKKADLYYCCRAAPRLTDALRFSLGFLHRDRLIAELYTFD